MTYEAEKPAVHGSGWVDLEAWTGRRQAQLPMVIREPDEALTHCESIVAALGDAGCDPRSGGMAGSGHLAAVFGVDAQQFKRTILPRLDFVRRLGGVPVTNVASIDAAAADYRSQVNQRKRARLGI